MALVSYYFWCQDFQLTVGSEAKSQMQTCVYKQPRINNVYGATAAANIPPSDKFPPIFEKHKDAIHDFVKITMLAIHGSPGFDKSQCRVF